MVEKPFDAVSCEKMLNQNYWDERYQSKLTSWDLGKVSPPLKEYVDQIQDKNLRILIPGCGNTYEAEYLLLKGFTNVTVLDIAPTLVASIRKKFKGNKQIKIIEGDFFEHHAVYDLIFEQTFFCALVPATRQHYVSKMHQLLAPNGLLVGLLFNRTFDAGPPFGGSKEEYQDLFGHFFNYKQFYICQNSVAPRAGTELFIEFQKKNCTS